MPGFEANLTWDEKKMKSTIAFLSPAKYGKEVVMRLAEHIYSTVKPTFIRWLKTKANLPALRGVTLDYRRYLGMGTLPYIATGTFIDSLTVAKKDPLIAKSRSYRVRFGIDGRRKTFNLGVMLDGRSLNRTHIWRLVAQLERGGRIRVTQRTVNYFGALARETQEPAIIHMYALFRRRLNSTINVKPRPIFRPFIAWYKKNELEVVGQKILKEYAAQEPM